MYKGEKGQHFVELSDSESASSSDSDSFREGEGFSTPLDRENASTDSKKQRQFFCFVISSVAVCLFILLLIPNTHKHKKSKDYSCTDSCCVYCQGSLLRSVQLAQVFNDSKHFVDLPMKSEPSAILKKWDDTFELNDSVIRAFVHEHFESDDTGDVSECWPVDYDSASNCPPTELLNGISDAKLRDFSCDVYAVWRQLCRTAVDAVYSEPLKHSLIAPLHPQMIVAGGRFREMYYWDSYFIVKGLLLTGLKTSALWLVENVINFTLTFGHMPNGNRVYYKHRSQPPLLFAMVKLFLDEDMYYYSSNDFVDIGDDNDSAKLNLTLAILALESEYKFWMGSNQFDTGTELNIYNVSGAKGPRPEGYFEDFAAAQSAADSEFVYRSLRSGAETGWDFSSRWCRGQQCASDLHNIDTVNVVPSDLNAFIYGLEVTLVELYSITIGANSQLTKDMNANATRRVQRMEEHLWDDSCACFRDYNLTSAGRIEGNTHAAQWIPLWTLPLNETRAAQMLEHLEGSGLLRSGGVLTTVTNDSQQWDSPNAWPPVQYMLAYAALRYNGSAVANRVAHNISQTLVSATYIGYESTGVIHEKYSALVLGDSGGGGEYKPQTGFGWTNGAIFSFLHDFGHKLLAPK